MKYRMQNLSLIVVLSSLLGCVGAQFNDVTPIQTQIEEQFAKTERELEVAKHDFAEKSSVFKTLSAASKKAAGMNEHFELMQTSIQTLSRKNEQIKTAKNQFSAAIKGKKQISSKDATWSDEQSAITSFNATMAEFNQLLADYSRESSTFGNLLSIHHVIIMAKIPEIRSRMADNIEKAKQNLRVLDADLSAAKKLAKQNGKPIDDASAQTLMAERNAFADRLKDLEGIFQHLIRDWGTKLQVSSNDADWDQFQKLITESEIKSNDIREIGNRLPVEIEAMRLSR